MATNPQDLSRAGYDTIAPHYLSWILRKKPHPEKSLAVFLRHLQSQTSSADVLELGCGAGIPFTETLAANCGHVTACDISSAQIALAQEQLKSHNNVTFVEGDMLSLTFAAGTFDAVTAFYSLVHLSPSDQEKIISQIHGWLKPRDGLFFCSFPAEKHTSVIDDWMGVSTYSSSPGSDGALAKLREAGFEIVWQDTSEDLDETDFLWVVARALHSQDGELQG